MNRIAALVYAFNDPARPAHEREAALAALRSLITDGSDPTECQQAQAAVNCLDGDHPQDAPCPLESQLLFQYHCASLSDVQHFDLHAFCADLGFNPPAQSLYMKWLSVSPAARAKTQQMRKHLENHFLASYDSMLRRYKEALDTGGDLNAADREALTFYRGWADSVVVPEEMKPHFRELISALSARCEAPRDNK